ncbi:hypothetical protein PVAND_014306 [Polypedilum vanderplanki]|uniref:Uncharacterized protein n=1 Tax=Polypedilum vanderplanki TaxID=319348 RepID=A0A9J6CT33_POLVA|nr:hypothetical protein PVAND_014306 [Polypedilum vanderplanki]
MERLQVVLRWIWNPNIKLPRFAISPISEILELTEIKQWKYVESKLNVADLATKFQSHEFGNPLSTWFTGPEFLKLDPEHWPSQNFTIEQKEMAITCSHQLVKIDKYDRADDDNIEELLPKRLPPFDCALLALIDPISQKIQYSAIMDQLIIRKAINLL